jgi:hypothetical protein
MVNQTGRTASRSSWAVVDLGPLLDDGQDCPAERGEADESGDPPSK